MTQHGKTPTNGSLEIAERFAAAACRGDARAISDMIADGLDVNAQDAEGMTGLHHAAAHGARPCIRLFVNSGKCDYLIEDNQGRTASTLAYEFGRDYAVGHLLAKKQAKARYLLAQQSAPSVSPGP